MKIMHCVFFGFVTAMGEKVTDPIRPIPHGLRARIKRLEDHPRLGPPDNHGFTITSEVFSIDFQCRLLFTKNSVYKY